jgi:hypothetical protein
MSFSTATNTAVIQRVEVNGNEIAVLLSDGRSVHVPLVWYPRLAHGLPADRQVHQLIGRGLGIHWPELDEDISLENILQGQASGESEQSFARWTDWYARRRAGQADPQEPPAQTGPG